MAPPYLLQAHLLQAHVPGAFDVSRHMGIVEYLPKRTPPRDREAPHGTRKVVRLVSWPAPVVDRIHMVLSP